LSRSSRADSSTSTASFFKNTLVLPIARCSSAFGFDTLLRTAAMNSRDTAGVPARASHRCNVDRPFVGVDGDPPPRLPALDVGGGVDGAPTMLNRDAVMDDAASESFFFLEDDGGVPPADAAPLLAASSSSTSSNKA